MGKLKFFYCLIKMTPREGLSNTILFLNHIAKRLLKKCFLIAAGLLLAAYLFLTFSRDFDSTSASNSEDEKDRFGRGRVSSVFARDSKKKEPFMVVCILSAPDNVQARQAARESWLTLIGKIAP